jgi:hypothetical protein
MSSSGTQLLSIIRKSKKKLRALVWLSSFNRTGAKHDLTGLFFDPVDNFQKVWAGYCSRSWFPALRFFGTGHHA